MGNRQLLIDSRFAGVRTNLAPNPSFEATSGVVEVRKNWATHPTVAGVTFVTATGTDLGWSTARGFGVGGAGSHSANGGADDTPVPGITSYGTKSWSAAVTAGNAADTGFQTNAWTGFTAGAVYTVSGWIRSSVARTLVGWTVQWNDATGVIQQATANTGALTAGLWSRFSIVTTAPTTGATNVVFILDTDGAQAIPNGTTVNVTGLLVEQVGAAGTATRLNYVSNPSFDRDTSNWAASGTSVPTISRQAAAGAFGTGFLRVVSTGTALYGAIS